VLLNAVYERPIYQNLAAPSPQFEARETPNPRHARHSFSACVGSIGGSENLSSDGLAVIIEEVALIGGHWDNRAGRQMGWSKRDRAETRRGNRFRPVSSPSGLCWGSARDD
jgi:hypothetical protein